MKIKTAFIYTLIGTTLLFSGCKTKKNAILEEPILLIETEYGNIKLKLYNETPIHRDNFLKLANKGVYDGTIFHRVIKNFMIQGGNPLTKDVSTTDSINLDYTLESELLPHIIHKKGALAAARLGDSQNPHKRSSGTQFYIVQGKIFNEEELEQVRKRKEDMIISSTTYRIVLERANKLLDKGIEPDFSEIYTQLQDTIQQLLSTLLPFQFSENQIDIYKTIGGTPHLDGDYTVFGEVIEGIDVVDKIASVQTGAADKPLRDIIMKISVLKK